MVIRFPWFYSADMTSSGGIPVSFELRDGGVWNTRWTKTYGFKFGSWFIGAIRGDALARHTQADEARPGAETSHE